MAECSSAVCNSIECNSAKASNLDNQQFTNEIKDYFISEIKEREL